ncbi:MAG: M50 family metallopeptidase [Solirubrobacteraceae bacterium]
MSYVLAFLGFAALIILHEAGHFVAAKAVGMRVERFSLFFGPLLVKFRRGETEYGIGPIPLGGYVKITGMNPNEDIPVQARPRAYYNQPVWKRVVVILAGPVVNLVIAFLIVWVLLLSLGQAVPATNVAAVQRGAPAAAVLKPGDTLVSVDGHRGSEVTLRNQIATHRCAGVAISGCRSATPVRIVLRRSGQLLTVNVHPRYVASARRMEVGFVFGSISTYPGPISAAGTSVSVLASTTARLVSTVVRIFEPQVRRQLHSVVGGYESTQQSFAQSTSKAFFVLALISLSLGVINLFPFLPLDGGHIFWAVAEKIRGRRIPFAVMERAGVVGFVLIIMIFFIGLSNDISQLSSGLPFAPR